MDFKTFEELSLKERRNIQGDGVRPNMKRIRECLLGINCDTPSRSRSFQAEIAHSHATMMHDYIIELEEKLKNVQ